MQHQIFLSLPVSSWFVATKVQILHLCVYKVLFIYKKSWQVFLPYSARPTGQWPLQRASRQNQGANQYSTRWSSRIKNSGLLGTRTRDVHTWRRRSVQLSHGLEAPISLRFSILLWNMYKSKLKHLSNDTPQESFIKNPSGILAGL